MTFIKPKKVVEDTRSPDEIRWVTAKEKFLKWFPELSEEQLEKVRVYMFELLRFNKTINLVSSASVLKLESTHFADAIFAGKIIFPALVPGKDIYDYGSGNGFPSLVLSCMYPNLKIHLVERDTRKAEFLKHVIATLGLKNCDVLVKSVEDLPEKSCTNVVTRGFAALHKTMLLARKQVPKGGKIFHLKGDSFSTELAMVPSQVFSYWNASILGNYTLPDTNTAEVIVLTEKIAD